MEEYCKFIFATGGVPPPGDRLCDPYYTLNPTLMPSTLKPTEYFFPTQSPRTQDDYEQYFEDRRRTSSPAYTPNELPPVEDNSTNAVGVGLGIAIGFVGVGFLFVYCIKRRRKKTRNAEEEQVWNDQDAAEMRPRENKFVDVALT